MIFSTLVILSINALAFTGATDVRRGLGSSRRSRNKNNMHLDEIADHYYYYNQTCSYVDTFEILMGPSYDQEIVDACDVTYDGTHGLTCDFTDLHSIFQAACEYEGKTLYSVSTNLNCTDSNPPVDWKIDNIPMCTDCDIYDDVIDKGVLDLEQLLPFGECSERGEDSYYEVDTVDSILSEQCQSEIASFTEEAGSGDPNFFFNSDDDAVIDFEEYCYTLSETDQVCNFTNFIELLQGPCEEEGGVLYTFSDKVHSFYNDTQTYLAESYINVPICVGSSCDGDSYFEDYIFPYYKFELTSIYDDYYEGTVIMTYEPIGYKRITDSGNKCNVQIPEWIGDDWCDGLEYNTPECDFDGGDCVEFNSKYPNCKVTRPYWIANGKCNGGSYNTEECGYDGGDCLFQSPTSAPIGGPGECLVEFEEWLGDGVCDGGPYNTPECQFDGGDCYEFNMKYPNCTVSMPFWIGDNTCDAGSEGYNTTECGYDGGDCLSNNTNRSNYYYYDDDYYYNDDDAATDRKRMRILEKVFDYFFPRPEDEVLEWQK